MMKGVGQVLSLQIALSNIGANKLYFEIHSLRFFLLISSYLNKKLILM